MKKSPCYGCNKLFKQNDAILCFYIIGPIHDKVSCPCVNCLVKNVCNRVCKEFNEYLSHYSKVYHRHIK